MTAGIAISNRLKSLCKEKGMSYGELAEKTGMPLRYIQRMAIGGYSNPAVFRLRRICDALGVTLDEFLDTEDFKDWKEYRM